MRFININFLKNNFVKNVSVLMTGTLLAQIFSYLLSPFISRLYSANEMADLGLYTRIVSLIAAISTARFEMAINLPKRNDHAFLIFRLTIKLILYTTFLSTLILFIVSYKLDNNYNNLWLYLLSILSALFVAFISLGSNWALRLGEFKSISFQRILNSVSSNILKLILGIFNLGSFGLILATTIGYILSSLGFFKRFINSKKIYYASSSKTRLLVKSYAQFPKVSLPHVIIDMTRDLLIAYFISIYFGKFIFGSYVYATMMLSLPVSIIGQSIGQVFFQKISKLYSLNQDIIKPLKLVTRNLFFLGLIPFGLLFFYGDTMFSFVFGEDWFIAGTYAEVLSIWMFINFILSPISNILIVINKQKQNFYLGLLATFGQLFCVILLPYFYQSFKLDFILLLWILSVSQAIILLLSCFLIFRFTYKLNNVIG